MNNVQIISYIPLDENGRKYCRIIGIKDHSEKIAGALMRFKYENGRYSFKEAYIKWNEWTIDNIILLEFE